MQDLDRLIATLENPTAPGARLDLAQLMSEGNAGVARIPGKHGTVPTAFATLTVLVEGCPRTYGQVASVWRYLHLVDIHVNLLSPATA